MKFALWIPGRFALTNTMLSNLRAAGYAKGKGDAKGWHRPIVDAFVEETRAIRLAAKAAFRHRCDLASVLIKAAHRPLYLGFWVFGHGRHDPDAWYLLAKAVTDGLADAGVISQDRHDVGGTRGLVLKVAQECNARSELLASHGLLPPLGAGVVVTVNDYAEG